MARCFLPGDQERDSSTSETSKTMNRLYITLFTLLMLPASVQAADYPDPTAWQYIIGGFTLEDEIIGDRHGLIVATGSSSMRFWDHRIHKDLAPLAIISRGFGGSNNSHVEDDAGS